MTAKLLHGANDSLSLDVGFLEKTRYGEECVSGCINDGTDYFWCWTRPGMWDYCSPVRKTRYNEDCLSECKRDGEWYHWCWTNSGSDTWDYCSPPPDQLAVCQVQQDEVATCPEGSWCGQPREVHNKVSRCLERTRYGHRCATKCKRDGYDYYWCRLDWHIGKWDYCAPQGLSRYNAKCVGECVIDLDKSSSFWCWTDTTESTWEYCSPGPTLEVPVKYTRYGQECQGACKKYLGWFHDYYFCQKSKRSESFWDNTIGWLLNKAFDKLGVRPLKWLNDGIGKIFGNDSDWEYCSAEPTRTMYNEGCTDKCESRGESYYWCHTAESWDYCSPPAEHQHGTVSGRQCVGKCDFRGSSYEWCHADGNFVLWSLTGYWDYCGASKVGTIAPGLNILLPSLALALCLY